eukprot:scaffold4151_cov106-Isochrysis_galbana.AAC.2
MSTRLHDTHDSIEDARTALALYKRGKGHRMQREEAADVAVPLQPHAFGLGRNGASFQWQNTSTRDARMTLLARIPPPRFLTLLAPSTRQASPQNPALGTTYLDNHTRATCRYVSIKAEGQAALDEAIHNIYKVGRETNWEVPEDPLY